MLPRPESGRDTTLRPRMTANTQPASEAAHQRVLVIDDDRKLCRLIRDYLEPLGFVVSAAHTGPDGVTAATTQCWHAVILDVMLPGCDGFSALKQIRAKSSVPVLMLTARGEEADRIAGLDGGADDYLPKTFSTRELLARLRAVTRRSAFTAAQDMAEVVVGYVRMDPATRTAKHGGKPLVLTPVEFDLLYSLVRAAGRVRTRDELMAEIREREYEVFDRSIDVHIAALRKKLGDTAQSPHYIQTVRAAGYLFLNPDKPPA
jgi:DNA-binding response OmpR family regulator